MTKNTRAFTLIELLLVIAVLFILAALLLPLFARSHRHPACRINCTNNLKQIGLSFITYAIDNNDLFPMQASPTNSGTTSFRLADVPWTLFQVMSNELSTPKILYCPADQTRKVATNFNSDLNNSKVSYFVNLAARGSDSRTNEFQVLAGDRNLVINGKDAAEIVNVNSNSQAAWSARIHNGKGNILQPDCSVLQLSTARLHERVRTLREPAVLAVP